MAPFSRNWVFTLQGETPPQFIPEKMKYMVYQQEKAPTTGQLHYQGYVVFHEQQRMKGASALVPRSHLEVRKGTHQQAIDYCTKQESRHQEPVTHGDATDGRATNGEREKHRWDDIKAAAQAGNFEEVPSEIYVKHYRTLKDIHDDHRPKPAILKHKRCGLWIHGPPNAGKTTLALEAFPDAYLKDPTTDYWKNYEGEEVVIIDDIHESNKATFLRNFREWINIAPFRARTFYGMRLIRPRLVICTSQHHFRDLTSGMADNAALEVRMDEIHIEQQIPRDS